MSWMHTFTGQRFYPRAPDLTRYNIRDIAHALSNICRFGGHTKHFYSVAEHSILASEVVASLGGTPAEQLWALLHDATEAYMGDIPTPLKATLGDYRDREDALMRYIAADLDLPAHGDGTLLPRIVKTADRIALVTEARQLVCNTEDWGDGYHDVPSHPVTVSKRHPRASERAFLRRYREILKELGQ